MGADESKMTHQKNKGPGKNKYVPPDMKSHPHSPDFKPPPSYQPPMRRRSLSSDRYPDNKENRRNDYHDNERRSRDRDERGKDAGRRHKRSNSDSSVFVTKETNHERRRKRSPRRRVKEEKDDKAESSPRGRDASPEKSKKKKSSPDRRHDDREREHKKRKKKRRKEKEKLQEQEKASKGDEGKENTESAEDPQVAPSKSEKTNTSKDKKREKGRRKRKKEVFDKSNSAYHSAPDLTKLDETRVGAWLNASGYFWPPPDGAQAWQEQPYPFPFPPYVPTQARIDESGNGEQIVDGLGYPIAPMFPTMLGPRSPNGTLRRPTSEVYAGSPQQLGGSPYFTLPYPYPYFHPLFFQNPNIPPDDEKSKQRTRSRSHDDDVTESLERNKQDFPTRERRVTSSEHDIQPSTSEPTYRANQAINVDDVKLASVVSKHQRISSPLLSSSSGEQSLSESSLNDVIIDDEGEKEGGVHVFQPLSNKEVFIDDGTPEKSAPPGDEESKSASSVSSRSTRPSDVISATDAKLNEASPRSENPPPIMTLCEKESIVATSFLTNGGKVFCLTRSKSNHAMENAVKQKPESAQANHVEPQIIRNQQPQPQEKKKDNGTWFQLTGSPPVPRVVNHPKPSLEPAPQNISSVKPTISSANHVTANRQELMEGRLFSAAPSRPTVTPQSVVRPVAPPPVAPKRFTREPRGETIVTSTQGNNPPSHYRSINQYRKLEKQGRVPEPEVKVEANRMTSGFSASSHTSSTDNMSFEIDASSSSDSNDVMYRSNSSLTNKLVRIDSHDSLTMKRRMRTHRRHSQNEGPFERRATIGSISKDDFMKAQSSVTGPVTRSSVAVTSPEAVNPFKYTESDDIAPFLTRAKSEEVLKEDMHKSSEELMIKWSPRQRKETLQERAARILGLSSQQLAEAKQRQMQQHDPTPSKRPLSNDVNTGDVGPESESFAVSVTSSMMERKEKYHVMEVRNEESSADDASTLSHDSSATPDGLTGTSIASIDGDTYTVHVSDSVLDAVVPCNVRPHPQSNAATEYRIPDDVLGSSDDDTSDDADWSDEEGVSEGQARIVASYSNNIYAHSPADATRYNREMSDETTESESVHTHPAASDLATFSRPKPNGIVTQQPAYQKRLQESPVPVGSHSAPLTPEELEIVMQLYNSADETASNGSDDSRKRQSRGGAHEEWKPKVASAIGYDLERPRAAPRRSPKFERVEDFEIKVFPGAGGARNHSTPPVSTQDTKEKKGDVIEAMQSVGLDPEQSWVVSL